MNPTETLNPLFEAAKAKDEFEYCCALLRVRGIEDAGWDPLAESFTLTQQLLTLIHAPIEGSFRLRQMLFLYCHLTEMDDLYGIVGNMLRIVQGYRYAINPFLGEFHPSKQPAQFPATKIDRIVEWSEVNGQPEVGKLFKDMFSKPLRNAFFHSDYVLTQESFNIKRGEPVRIGNTLDPKVPLAWVTEKVELGINTGLAVMGSTMQRLHAFTSNRVVKGRMQGDSPVDVELIAQEGRGLVGFRCPPKI